MSIEIVLSLPLIKARIEQKQGRPHMRVGILGHKATPSLGQWVGLHTIRIDLMRIARANIGKDGNSRINLSHDVSILPNAGTVNKKPHFRNSLDHGLRIGSVDTIRYIVGVQQRGETASGRSRNDDSRGL